MHTIAGCVIMLTCQFVGLLDAAAAARLVTPTTAGAAHILLLT
jgi:hypothetical protein